MKFSPQLSLVVMGFGAYQPWVFVAAPALVAAAAYCWYFFNPPAKRAIAAVRRLDRARRRRPDRIQRGYAATIRTLEILLNDGKLGPAGRIALGKAYVGDGAAQLLNHEPAAARARFKQAARFFAPAGYEAAILLARDFAKTGEQTHDAVRAYLGFLRLPRRLVEPALANRILAVLAQACEIDESATTDQLPWRVKLNDTVTVLTGSAPCLWSEDPDAVAHRYLLGDVTTIGEARENDIVLHDPAVAMKQASIEKDAETYLLYRAASSARTTLNGADFDSPAALSDGDVITCGATSLNFCREPRYLDEAPAWSYRNLAMAAFRDLDFPRARALLSKAAKLAPKDAIVKYYLARTCHAQAQYAEAIKAYGEAAVGNDTAAFQYWWGRALMELSVKPAATTTSISSSQMLGQAITHIEKSVGLAPKNGPYRFALAKAYAGAGQLPRAMEAARAAIAVDETTIEYRLLLADLARKSGDRALAREVATTVLGVDSQNCNARMILGDLAFDEEDFTAALVQFESVRRIEAEHRVNTFSSTEGFAWRMGRSLFEAGDYEKASRYLVVAAQTSPRAMFYDARCHAHDGRFANAATLFKLILRDHGDYGDVHYHLASALANMEQYDAALQEADRASGQPTSITGDAVAPGAWSVHCLCVAARILTKLDRLEDALDRLEQAAGAAPNSEKVDFERGRLALVRGDLDAAQLAFEASLRESPHDAQSHFWLARVYFAGVQFESAARHFKRAIAAAAHGGRSADTAAVLKGSAQSFLNRIQQQDAASPSESPRLLTELKADVLSLISFER